MPKGFFHDQERLLNALYFSKLFETYRYLFYRCL